MICPKCGHQNSDSAAMCKKCYYKFNFGHAHGDPGKTFYFVSSPAKRKWVSVALIIVFVLFIVIFLLSLISSFKCDRLTPVAESHRRPSSDVQAPHPLSRIVSPCSPAQNALSADFPEIPFPFPEPFPP